MSRIRSGYNFQNVSVDYRYGTEDPDPISEFSQPITQKQISFTLIGKSSPGSAVGSNQFLADPLFEEFGVIESVHTGVYAEEVHQILE